MTDHINLDDLYKIIGELIVQNMLLRRQVAESVDKAPVEAPTERPRLARVE